LRIKKIEVSNNLKLMKSKLNKSLGQNIQTQINISPVNIRIQNIENYSTLENELENRLELKSADQKIEMAKELKKIAQSEYYPSIYAFGEYEYSNPNQRILPLETKFNDTWSVGLTLKWNLFNWGGTKSKSEEAEYKTDAAKEFKKYLKKNLSLELYKNYLNLKIEIEKLELTQKQKEEVAENLRIIRNKYINQLTTSAELIDAETDYFNAEINFRNSKLNYFLAKKRLDKSVGRKLYK